jgi:hypothetical protein
MTSVRNSHYLIIVSYNCKVTPLIVLRMIFGPKREEVAGGWSRLRNEELRNLYTSPNIVRVIKWRRTIWARHVAGMTEMRNTYNILIGICEGKRPLGRSKRRWENNIFEVFYCCPYTLQWRWCLYLLLQELYDTASVTVLPRLTYIH